MTPNEYRELLDLYGISQLGASRMLGVNAKTSRNWARYHVLVMKRTDVAWFELFKLIHVELRRAQNHSLLLIKNAPERVATFLLEMAERIESSKEVELPMSRRDIADYLGLTIETVSRALRNLERHSAIALPNARQIVLRDPRALKQLALGRATAAET